MMCDSDSEEEQAKKPPMSSSNSKSIIPKSNQAISETIWLVSLIETEGRKRCPHAVLVFEGTGIPEKPDLKFPLLLEFGPQDPEWTDLTSFRNFIFRRGKPVKFQHLPRDNNLLIKRNISWAVPKIEVVKLFNELFDGDGGAISTPIYNACGDSSNSSYHKEEGIHNCITYAVSILKQIPSIAIRIKYDDPNWKIIKSWFPKLPKQVIKNLCKDI